MALGDMDQVLEVEKDCYAHPWSAESFRSELESPVSRVELLLCGGRLAGYLCSRSVAGELEVLNVAVSTVFRRRGVARRLLIHCLQNSQACPLEKAFLEVRVGNAGAIALYNSIGFRNLGLRKGYYPDGEDALVMEWVAGETPSTL